MNEPGSTSGRPQAPTPDPAEDSIVFQVTEATLRKLLTQIRRCLDWLTIGYLAALVVVLATFEWWGERFWLVGVLLYGPPQVWLVPLFLLSPLCLIFRRRLLRWHALAFLVVIFGYMHFTWHGTAAVHSSDLRAVTFNYGESNRAQFLAFLDAEKPDVILLQDAAGRGADLARRYPAMYASDLDQFAFLSKYPIQKAEIVSAVQDHGHPIAARYELQIQGRPVAFYSVHLPTPRAQLVRFIGGRRILGDLVGHASHRAMYGNFRDWLADRTVMARALAGILDSEALPVIVAGDFNTPDHGYIYRFFQGKLTDAFAKVGRGWGLTFPGSTHDPLTLFGPWLRIDYFFEGHGWRVLECRPEPGQKSQHKAVFARFEAVALGGQGSLGRRGVEDLACLDRRTVFPVFSTSLRLKSMIPSSPCL